MANYRFGHRTWKEISELDSGNLVCILPLGAVEAHGPHLPLLTDGVMAEAMAEATAERLIEDGFAAQVLPRFDYSAAPFAEEFPGTISIRPETAQSLIFDVARSLEGRARALAIANCHLDPAHLASIWAAVNEIENRLSIPVAFADLTRKPWALRLTDEFKSGACHAGRFEGSVVMAVRPELVRDDLRRALPENPASMSTAIREGRRTFTEAGGPQAYFGAPADATAEEGHETIGVLAGILRDATLQRVQG